MNQIILFSNERQKESPSHFIINKCDHRFLHIKNHLKLMVSDSLKVALIGEGIGEAQIIKLHEDEIHLNLNSDLKKNQSPIEIEIIMGLGQPKQMIRMLEQGTQLGVSKFQIIKCQLSEKNYLSSPFLDVKNINQALLKGLAQSAYYSHLPEVSVKKYFPREWKINNESHIKLALDPYKKRSLSSLPLQNIKSLQILLGPERGLTTKEKENLDLYGFEFCDLGPSILRSEVALSSFMGQLKTTLDYQKTI